MANDKAIKLNPAAFDRVTAELTDVEAGIVFRAFLYEQAERLMMRPKGCAAALQSLTAKKLIEERDGYIYYVGPSLIWTGR